MVDNTVLERNREIVKKCANLLRAFSNRKSFILLPLLLLIDRRGIDLSRYRNSLVHGISRISDFDLFKELLESTDKPILDILRRNLDFLEKINVSQFLNFYEICSYVNTQQLSQEEFNIFYDEVLDVYINTISRYNDLFSQPKGLSEVVSNIYPLEAGMNIYNAFAGSFSLASYISDNVNVFGEEINEDVYTLAIMRILAHEKEGCVNISNANSFESPWGNKRYDFVYAFPPFGTRLRRDEIHANLSNYINVDANFIASNIDRLEESGKMIVIVRSSFLNAGGEYRNLKENLVRKNLLDKVIMFPVGTLANIGTSYAMLCLDNDKHDDKVLMFDASSCYTKERSRKFIEASAILSRISSMEEGENCKIISYSSIEKENYSLSLNRYLVDIPMTDEKTLLLKDVLLKASSRRDINNNIPFISIKDLKDDIIDYTLVYDDIKDNEGRDYNTFIISEDVILFSSIGGNLKSTLLKTGNKEVSIIPNIYIYKVKEDVVNVDYLIAELKSDYVLKQIKRCLSSGVALQRIIKAAFENISVRVPNKQTQEARVRGFKEAIIESRQKEVDLLAEKYEIKEQAYKDLSMLKHNVGKYLSAASSGVNILNKYLKNYNKDLLEEVVSKRNLRTFSDVLQSIDNKVQDAIDYMQKSEIGLRGNVLGIKPVICNVKQFLAELKLSIKDDLFSLETKGLGDIKDTLSFNIDESEIKMVFSNLISNVKTHGFIDESKNNTVRLIYSLLNEESIDCLSIKYYNNGVPFPKGLDFDKYITKNLSVGVEGTGLGGFYINEVIKQHKGIFRSLLNIDEKFPVGFEILLPVEL